MECEGHKSLPSGWDWATQESCMDFKFKKPCISGVEPVKERKDKEVLSLNAMQIYKLLLFMVIKVLSPSPAFQLSLVL